MSKFTRFSMGNVLKQNLNRIIGVRLQNGESLQGRLRQFDEHLNLLLEMTEDEISSRDKKKARFIVIRGNNVVVLCDLVFVEVGF